MSQFMQPGSTVNPPRGLSLEQFIQTLLVGLSALGGPLVRPKWQPAPPKQPDINEDWMAFGVNVSTPDANGYLGVNPDGSSQYQRHEALEITCSVYGPKAFEVYGLLRDGFQIPQNLDQLRAANMGFVEISRALHLPELINERFFNRYEFTINLRHEVIRTYPILTFLSASGTIHTVVGNEDYLLNWQVQET